MHYWTPTSPSSELQVWNPRWNPAFSEKDKLTCTNLFFFFKNKKRFTDSQAETLAQMYSFKQKYPGLKYTLEQETTLRTALKPVFNR